MADYARAELLRDLRAQTHRSREYVAAEVGVTTKTLYEWENGGKIKWENAKKLAAFYGVDPEVLVARDIPERAASDAPTTQLDRIEAKLDALLAMATGNEIAEPPGEVIVRAIEDQLGTNNAPSPTAAGTTDATPPATAPAPAPARGKRHTAKRRAG